MGGRFARFPGRHAQDRVADPDVVALDAELFKQSLPFGGIKLFAGAVNPTANAACFKM